MLQTFLFEGLPVRGALVRLTDAWRELLRRRESAPFPQPVRALLGEMTAAGVLMQSNIRFDGALILQISGDTPVKLAVAEVRSDFGFRATAQVVGAVPADAGLEALVNTQGRGRCAITLSPAAGDDGRQPYQGIVPLHGDRREPLQHVAQVLEHYMLQSEQLDTRLVLAADDNVAAGLVIQRLPVHGQGNLDGARRDVQDEDEIGRNEAYNRIATLAATLTRDELLKLEPPQILRRLFWDETVRIFDPQQPRFACTCTRDRVRDMLRALGRDESDSLIAERGSVEVGCEFCGRQYRFDAVDVGEMFTPGRDQPPAPGTFQ